MRPQIFTSAVVLFSFSAYVFSFPCLGDRTHKTWAIKSFSTGKYLEVKRAVGLGVFRLSFTGNSDICHNSKLFAQRRCQDSSTFTMFESVAFPGYYLAVENGKLTLSKQPTDRIEDKCQFSFHRVYVSYNFDNPTLYWAVKLRATNSYIRISKSGKFSLRKKWKVDCGVWLHFNLTISCS
ncbi:uncharacterized protein [Montipora capricornis]|uniref:uncharacterized protein n=1 Tax=Montipora foliosa TaxID=591990 RepID=UPI0035F15A04